MNVTPEWLIENGISPETLGTCLGKTPAVAVPDSAQRHGHRPAIRKINDLGQNKTEARFDGYLEGKKTLREIRDFRFEPFNLRLPGRVWFRLDFIVLRLDGSLALIDVKGGPIEDDSLVKLKTCSEVHSWLGEVYVARYQFKAWNLYRVSHGRVDKVPDLHWTSNQRTTP